MKITRYEGDIEPLIKWAVNRRDIVPSRDYPPEPFRSWIRDQMPESCRDQIHHWVGVTTPDTTVDNGWALGYPHTHINSRSWPTEATTVMLYLTAPKAGGQFGLGGLNEDDPYEFIDVEPGMSVSVDAATWHGVKPVQEGVRLALITTGFPKP